MGVMECSRAGCSNILCSSYSKDYGYICSDCKNELKALNPLTLKEIKFFMKSKKEIKFEVGIDVDEVFSD